MNLGTQMTKRGQFAHCKTLHDLVREYNRHFKEKFDHHDPVVNLCKEAKNMPDAIRKAVDGRRRDGKLFPGGSCVRTKSKKALERALLRQSVVGRLKRAKTFEQIYDAVREVRPWGVADYTTYNTAARIAAFKGIYPRSFVYLHAGPLLGWKRLTREKGRPHRISLNQVPKALRALPLHSIEDFMCEMRDVLDPSFLGRR